MNYISLLAHSEALVFAANAVYLDFLINLGLYLVLPITVCVAAWHFTAIKPTSRLVGVVLGWVVVWTLWRVLAVAQSDWLIRLRDVLSYVWLYGMLLLGALILLDFIMLLLTPKPRTRRKLPSRFARDVMADVEVVISNPAGFAMEVKFHDGLPEEAICELLPWRGKLPARGYQKITYPLLFNQRGDTYLEQSYIQYSTKLNFWSRTIRTGEEQETKVYPNYEPILQYALLSMESSPEQMGIVTKNRVGVSKEFHQLRDYQLGDMLSQIDWKATSKHRALISREFQEQKDQNLILAIDCGRRMRAVDGGVPQFDHCLNAMLLLAYVALKQGDHVGILSFGGNERWLPPVKGVQSMTTILNHLYDYQTSTSPSDFSEAAERLLTRQRRRALVVVLTNVRGEDGEDLVTPLRRVRSKHLVMVANLREQEVTEKYTREIVGLNDALTFAATQIYLDERAAVMRNLRGHGIHTVDATAKELPVALANRYLAEREML